MHREVQGLLWVRALSERPACIPQGRPRGAKRDGVKFETTLARQAPFASAQKGLWLEFGDASGHGYAQPDFVWNLHGGGPLFVAEAKLTWKLGAYSQLRKLYFPLLRKLTGREVRGVVVCANLTRETPRAEVCDTFTEAWDRALRDPSCVPVVRIEATQAKSRTKTRAVVPKWYGRGGASRPILGV